MRRLWIVAAVVFAGMGEARAELYSYVDKEGNLHFTNASDDPRARPHPLQNKENTFEWQDALGAMRQVHKVDVTRYDAIILEAARYYTLPPALIKAVIAVESSFEHAAVSHAGAKGLMQLIGRTARAMHVRDVFDPRDNIFGGARYLRTMANRFDGDIPRTIAAYNAGPEAVERHQGLPPYKETQQYVRRVLKLYRYYLESGMK